MIMPVLKSTSRVCPHWRVIWDPAATVATLLETITNGLGPPLQVISPEVTSVIGCEENGFVSSWYVAMRKEKKKRKAHSIVGRETHVVESCLHDSIDTNLLEDGVRRSSTRKDERSNDGLHFFFLNLVHVGMKNSMKKKKKKTGDRLPFYLEENLFTTISYFPPCPPLINSFIFV